jgi:hypothetical protein
MAGIRKLIRPTPEFTIPPPYNPIRGDHNELQVYGTFPYCAIMQIAEEDKYDNYVVCRGFDPRILKFVDFQKGNQDKLGISVAKPFGCRVKDIRSNGPKRYRIGEVYAAFLPTQGSTDYNAHYIPPSPVEVLWRLGQNPGVNEDSPYGGHPKCIVDEISKLEDHNGQMVNWMLVNTETKFFKFHALEDLEDGSCEACVRQMSDYQPHVADIYDPYDLFKGMKTDTKGVVVFQEGKYYIITVENKNRHYRFQSLEDMGSGTVVNACIQEMEGGNKREDDIHDPDGIFEDMEEGTKGIVVFQDGKYWIIQAKCEPDEIEECECDPETEDCEEEELNCDCEPESEEETDCECPYPPE